MKVCRKCSSPNDEMLDRCARCGARLPIAVTQESAPGAPPEAEPVNRHLGLSILATVLFIPFGLMALIQAAQVNGWVAAGQPDRAVDAAARAKRWASAGIITGAVLDAILIFAARLV